MISILTMPRSAESVERTAPAGMAAGTGGATPSSSLITRETVDGALRQFADELEVKAGLFINASRTMLTGQSVRPSMFEVFEILGRDRSVDRLRSGVPWFAAMEQGGTL